MDFKLALILVLALASVNADMKKKIVKKWMGHIEKHHFMTSCWGEKTMMKLMKGVMDACEECQQLTPAFDIDLFDEDDDDDDDLFDLRPQPTNPFFVTQQGLQTLPAQAAFGGLRGQRVQNPMQAWMAAWAPIYGQQAAASGFAGYPVRGKRAVDPQSEAEMAEFAEKVADFKEMKKDNIGNLSCVLSKMGAFDDNLNIRLTHFTNEIWAETARGEEQEPEFIKQMNEGFQNCYQLSQSIPQDLLARKGKFYEQFGRQKMFFKCKKMLTAEMCVKKELVKWVDYLYGIPSEQKRQELGLPNDVYDAALMGMTVKMYNQNPAEKFVHEFFFGHE